MKPLERFSARRARGVARPRQSGMYLAKRLTTRSLPEIGRKFGGRDHSTVIHAVRRIEELRDSDRDVDGAVRQLMHQLEGCRSHWPCCTPVMPDLLIGRASCRERVGQNVWI